MADFSNKVIYQIYPKSFKDSNGDGIGDLRGVAEKLDYLKDLGVDYLWLTPFFVSPQRDNGYDVADYRNIDPMFGTMEDLDNLIAEGEKRNIGLMFDMVFNHTSTSHEWFRRALAGEKKYQDYYIFKEGAPDQPPTNWQSKFGGSAWEYVSSLGKWYLHLFDVTQADLNWKNPEVREELKEVIRFWKAKGVKGFRFDVVNLISKPEIWEDDFEGDGRKFYTDGPYVHEYLKELVRDTGIEDYVTVGEMSSTTLEHCIRYSGAEEKELSMCFNFHHLKVDYKDGNKWELMEPDYMELKVIFEKWQMGMQRGNAWNALFWCNHDQPRIVSRFGNEGEYWKESAKMLAGMIHLMRGTPYIYQGEEIGMTNPHYTSIEQYADEFPGSTFIAGKRPWEVKADIALPCATQNELNGDDARQLIENKVMCVGEISNMGCTPEAIDLFIEHKIMYAPGKAVNAGGVATSGLEMSQNAMHLSWSAAEVDEKLHAIMHGIHAQCVKYGTEPDGYINYVKGANIAGFMKVAHAMMGQGII